MGTAPAAIEWRCSDRPMPYDEAVAEMERRIAAIRAGSAPELVWLLEHSPLYTAGTSARPADLLDPQRLPVYQSGRGGQYTYHGPGQRIAYVMLDLNGYGRDVRCHVWRLEEWMIRTLARFDVTGERRDGRIGVWIAGGPMEQGGRDDKIAAIGVRVRHWVTYHGIALNPVRRDRSRRHLAGAARHHRLDGRNRHRPARHLRRGVRRSRGLCTTNPLPRRGRGCRRAKPEGG